MVGSDTRFCCGARVPYGEECGCNGEISFTFTTGGKRFLQVSEGNQMWIIDTKRSRCVSVPLFAAKEVLKALKGLLE